MNSPDALNPESALAEVAALSLEDRPGALLRLAEDLERRIDSTNAAGAGETARVEENRGGVGGPPPTVHENRGGVGGPPPTAEHAPGEP